MFNELTDGIFSVTGHISTEVRLTKVPEQRPAMGALSIEEALSQAQIGRAQVIRGSVRLGVSNRPSEWVIYSKGGKPHYDVPGVSFLVMSHDDTVPDIKGAYSIGDGTVLHIRTVYRTAVGTYPIPKLVGE